MAQSLLDKKQPDTFEIQTKKSQEKPYKNVKQLTLVVIGLGLAPFFFGYSFSYLSSVPLDTLDSDFGSQSTQPIFYGFLLGAIPLGAAFGALLAPILMVNLTRKNTMILLNCFALVVGGILQIPNSYVLMTCRILQGILSGLFMAITPIYINQVCPKDLVGNFGVFSQLQIGMGVLIAYIIGMIFNLADSTGEIMWRFMFAFCLLPNLIQLVLFFTGFIPESPTSLVEKGRDGQARQFFELFNRTDLVDEIMKERKKMVGGQTQSESEKITTTKISLFLGFQLPFMQQMSGIGVAATQIVQLVQLFNPELAIYTPVITLSLQNLATLAAVFALSKWGRRPILLIGNCGLGIIDILLGILFLFSDWRPAITFIVVLFTIFFIIFGFTTGPLVWLYVPEIIPAKIVPFATFLNWVGCTIGIVLTPIIINAVGSPYPIFFMFGGLSLILLVFNFLWVVETKGLTASEISAKFKR